MKGILYISLFFLIMTVIMATCGVFAAMKGQYAFVIAIVFCQVGLSYFVYQALITEGKAYASTRTHHCRRTEGGKEDNQRRVGTATTRPPRPSVTYRRR